MNKEKNKHDHKLTNLLKVGIFALLMIAPLFASVSQWMYATINKNAYQSYSNQMVEQQVSVNNPNELIEYQTYIVNYKQYETTEFNYTPYIYYYEINVNWSDYTSTDTTNVVAWRLRTNDNLLQLRNADNSTINLFNVFGNTLKTFTMTFKSLEYASSTAFLNLTIYGIYYNTAKLDNAFYYGVEQMTESNLFNWTENTTIYTGIKGMTDNLEIQTNAIAILLTYWTILTIVYVIFDILIQGFTFITHKIVE